MSTDQARRATARAMLLGALAATGCLPHRTGTSALDVCRGLNVGEQLALALDSLGPAAGQVLHRLQGRQFHITLTLANPLTTVHCQDRVGSAFVTVDKLPDDLAAGTDPKKGGQWRIEGTRVAVNLNPGVVDNNLQFSLPLDGSPGAWTLSTFAGRVAWGRLLPTGS